MRPGKDTSVSVPAATSAGRPSGQAVWVRVGAGAALVGGCLWIAKGGAILVTGHQPPLMFEAAAFAFPVALRGLDALLRRREPAPHRAAATAATVALVVGVALLVLFAVIDDPPDVVTSLAAATMGLATVVSLLLLGAACRRSGGLSAPWARLPWIMGLALVPSMSVVGGLLAAVHERLLELPIVVYGVAWVILGYAMLATPGTTQSKVNPEGSGVAENRSAAGTRQTS